MQKLSLFLSNWHFQASGFGQFVPVFSIGSILVGLTFAHYLRK